MVVQPAFVSDLVRSLNDRVSGDKAEAHSMTVALFLCGNVHVMKLNSSFWLCFCVE